MQPGNAAHKPDPTDDTTAAAKPLGSRRKCRWWILSTAALILFIVYFTYTPIISSIIATRIHQAIERRLHASVQYDSLTYIFPYRVRLQNVQLHTDASLGNDQLLRIATLDLRLAKIPLPHRPLVIKSLLIQSPELHIIRNPAGVAGATGLVKRADEQQAAPPEHPLSEMFELRQFTIEDGKLVYEDRTIAGVAPLIYSGIAIDLGLTPKDKSLYAYQFETRQPPLVDIAANGTIDIDSLVLAFSRVTLRAEVSGATDQSPLPPVVQQAINRLGIAGAFSINGSGEIPLNHSHDASFSGDINIDNARADFGSHLGRVDQLDAKTRFDVRGGEGQIHLTSFAARSGAARLTLNEMIAQISRGKWSVPSVSGTIDAQAPGPTTQPADIFGTYVLGGTVMLGGNASGDFSSRPNLSIIAQPQNLSILPPGFAHPIDSVKGQLHLTPQIIEFWDMNGGILSGTLAARGIINLTKPMQYNVHVQADNIDLAQLTSMPLLKDRCASVSGVAKLDSTIKGTIPGDGATMLDQLSADGEAQATHGQFWEVACLGNIAEQVGIHREALTIGEAAAVFSVDHSTLTLRHGAVNSSVLGLQGKGTLGFNGNVNLDVIAAPLGDWRAHIQKAKIPIVGDVAGQLAHGVQKMVNGATSRFLYEFQIVGKLPKPQVKAIPAPLLTDATANVFGKMLQPFQASDLLKSIKEGD